MNTFGALMASSRFTLEISLIQRIRVPKIGSVDTISDFGGSESQHGPQKNNRVLAFRAIDPIRDFFVRFLLCSYVHYRS